MFKLLSLLMIFLKDEKHLQFEAENATSGWLEQFKSLPLWSSLTHLAFSVLTMVTLKVIGIFLLPHVVKYALSSVLKICAYPHHTCLKTVT